MKGFYTQGFVVLTDRLVGIEELRPLLPEFPFLRTAPASEEWAFGGETAVIGFRPEVNGMVILDTVEQVWPDHMGHPQENPTIFGAWSMGHFGPLTFPRGLERAVAQAWTWPAARERVLQHRAFIRLRLTYIAGAGLEAAVMPADYESRAELEFVTDIVRCVLRHPAAICYFNPGGEKVLPAEQVDGLANHNRQHKLPSLNVWTNVRLFNLSETWLLMDCVGNGQLDLADHEFAFPRNALEPAEVDRRIRDTTLYLLQKGDVIQDGHTIDGPGGKKWIARKVDEPVVAPPRPVLRWVPADAGDIPDAIAVRRKTTPPIPATPLPREPPTSTKRPWWKF